MLLFSDPREWAGSMVKTWTRFWIMGVLLTLCIGVIIRVTASAGVLSGICASLYMVVMQFFFLYALRRLYFEQPKSDEATNAG